jgi:hypothetical protein
VLRRFLLTALLVGGLFGCLPVSQIPRPGASGPDPVEPVALDVPDLTGNWVVENTEGTLRQLWTLQMVGNVVTGEFVTDPAKLPAGASEQPRPVQGRVIGSGNVWGVRLETPGGTITIQDRSKFSYCPEVGNPNACRAGKRYEGTAPPAPSPVGSSSGAPARGSPAVPSATPTWRIIR